MNLRKLFECPQDRCPHWSRATKYPRKCYYEPQCWKGYLSILKQIKEVRK